MIKLGSLFDGSGAFQLAGQHVGMTPVWASEIVPYCIAVTKQHFPDTKHLGDINNVDGRTITPVHVLTFSSPCQNLSTAGNREGIQHVAHGGQTTTESGLFYEAVRIIKEMRESTNGEYPKYAVWENVPGALSSNGGRDFYTVLTELVAVCRQSDHVPEPRSVKGRYDWRNAGLVEGDGYSLAWRMLDAQHYTPQRRKRIYLVVDFTGQRAGEILFEQESLPGHAEPGSEAREGSATTPDGGHHGSAGFLSNQGGKAHSIGFVPEQCPTIMSSPAGNSIPAVVYDARGNGDGKIVPTLTGDHERRITDYTAVCIGNGQIHQMHLNDLCGALDCMHDQKSVLITHDNKHSLRRLMPVECARLQGMPDEWGWIEPFPDWTKEDLRFWIDVRNTWARINGKEEKEYTEKQMLVWYHKLHSDAQEYRMYGNGICLPCAEFVLKRITNIIGRNSDNGNSDQDGVV